MSEESDGLVARIRQIRRVLAPPDVLTPLRPNLGGDPKADLEARVAHLEQMVQGLQDSVYREAQRQEKRVTELEARLDPVALSAALSKDARERGL
ncbi:MAG: hypothetical protein ABI323_14880 [Solirubrobacteraceae bacterium]